MNNRYVLLVLYFFSVSALVQAFEDKPALGTVELGFRKASKAVGLGAGSVTGGAAGLVGGGLTGRRLAVKDFKSGDKLGSFDENEAKFTGFVLGGVAGLPAGVVVGAPVGYKIGGFVALRALAQYHGVPTTVEMVSQFYDINLLQYGSMLITAEKKANIDYLNRAIDSIYIERFGANWKERLVSLFNSYKEVKNLFSARAYFPKDEKDFARMMELGAAMSNLYFKTKPNVKNIVHDATKMYQMLGLL